MSNLESITTTTPPPSTQQQIIRNTMNNNTQITTNCPPQARKQNGIQEESKRNPREYNGNPIGIQGESNRNPIAIQYESNKDSIRFTLIAKRGRRHGEATKFHNFGASSQNASQIVLFGCWNWRF